MKNLKTIALIAIVILAVSCKKDKQKTCKLSHISSRTDSTFYTYNADGKISKISNFLNWSSSGSKIDLDYHFTNNNCRIDVTTNIGISPFSVNYILNNAGNIIECTDSVLGSGGIYYKTIRKSRYNDNNQIIANEIIYFENGIFDFAKKDSFAYEANNLTRIYKYKKTSTLYRQDGYIDVEYGTDINQNENYTLERYILNDWVVSSHFGGGIPPFLFPLLGKSSNNIPTKITEYNNASEIELTNTFNNSFNENGTLNKQEEVIFRAPSSTENNTIIYNYTCN